MIEKTRFLIGEDGEPQEVPCPPEGPERRPPVLEVIIDDPVTVGRPRKGGSSRERIWNKKINYWTMLCLATQEPLRLHDLANRVWSRTPKIDQVYIRLHIKLLARQGFLATDDQGRLYRTDMAMDVLRLTEDASDEA